nr:unnamed protein product [Spirometra erinaceieuropaei]
MSSQSKEVCKDVWMEVIAMGVYLGDNLSNTFPYNNGQISSCPSDSPIPGFNCCDQLLESALQKKSIEEVNYSVRAYLKIWPNELQKLIELVTKKANWIGSESEPSRAVSCSWMLYDFAREQIGQLMPTHRSFSPWAFTVSSLRVVPCPSQSSRVHMEPAAGPLADSVNHLLSTMLYAREILHSLRLLTRLLNQLVNYDASSEGCGSALMRMRHCALCSGHLLTYPCPALCSATLDFCLRPLLALRPLWEGIFGLIELEIAQWIESPRGTLYWSVSQLPGHVNFVARIIIATFSDKFQKECPLYEDPHRPAQELTLRLKSWVKQADAAFRSRLTGRSHDIEDILLKVQTIKRLWADASSAICHESPYLFSSMATEDSCWNGTAIGP